MSEVEESAEWVSVNQYDQSAGIIDESVNVKELKALGAITYTYRWVHRSEFRSPHRLMHCRRVPHPWPICLHRSVRK
jgi:hypothetical protein